MRALSENSKTLFVGGHSMNLKIFILNLLEEKNGSLTGKPGAALSDEIRIKCKAAGFIKNNEIVKLEFIDGQLTDCTPKFFVPPKPDAAAGADDKEVQYLSEFQTRLSKLKNSM